MIRDLYRFLGVDDGFLPDQSQRFNVTGVTENPLWRLLRNGTHGLRSHLITLAPMSLRGRLADLAAHLPVRKAALEAFDPALRTRLTAAYRDDILALQEVLGRDLSVWLDCVTPSVQAH